MSNSFFYWTEHMINEKRQLCLVKFKTGLIIQDPSPVPSDPKILM